MSNNPPAELSEASLTLSLCFCLHQGECFLYSPDSVCWTFPVTLSWHRKLMAAVLDNWRPCCPTLWACTRSSCRPVVWQQTASSISVRFLLFWIYSALCCLKVCHFNRRDLGFKLLDLPPLVVLQVVHSAHFLL